MQNKLLQRDTVVLHGLSQYHISLPRFFPTLLDSSQLISNDIFRIGRCLLVLLLSLQEAPNIILSLQEAPNTTFVFVGACQYYICFCRRLPILLLSLQEAPNTTFVFAGGSQYYFSLPGSGAGFLGGVWE